MAYLEPNNIRQIAMKLQNISGPPSNYSKAHPIITKLTAKNYIKFNYEERKYYVNIPKLASEISLILQSKEISLTNTEIGYLERLLQEHEFFKLISQDIVKKIQNQEKSKHEINALDVFCEQIGGLASTFLIQRKMGNVKNEPAFGVIGKDLSISELNEELNNFQTIWDNIIKQMEPRLKKELRNNPLVDLFLERIFPMFKIMPSVSIFFAMSDITLEKFAKLWDRYDGVKIALDLAEIYKKK